MCTYGGNIGNKNLDKISREVKSIYTENCHFIIYQNASLMAFQRTVFQKDTKAKLTKSKWTESLMRDLLNKKHKRMQAII